MRRYKFLVILIILISSVAMSSIGIQSEDTSIMPDVIENECIDLMKYYSENPDILQKKTEPIRNAKMLATIADAVAPDSDDICKIAIMDCIVNRTRATGFPNSIEEVCLQKNQWQGYTSESTYSDETYRLAKQYIDQMGEFRIRSIESNMVYLRLGNNGIFFRSTWDSDMETYVPYFTT